MPSLILASASPRRRDLLEKAGFHFSVVPSNADEVVPDYLSPAEVALFNATIKARTVSMLHREAVVVGVDTLVEMEGRIFGKPKDLAEARRMLECLNGRDHSVFSGVAVVGPKRSRTFVDWTRVHFHRRAAVEIERYLARIGPLDKAGGYAAQNDRGEMIKAVEGSFTNVIGLPMERLRPILEAEGITPAAPSL
ncbi:MAG: Maf family protein [Chthoniobacteraceae bacterium]